MKYEFGIKFLTLTVTCTAKPHFAVSKLGVEIPDAQNSAKNRSLAAMAMPNV